MLQIALEEASLEVRLVTEPPTNKAPTFDVESEKVAIIGMSGRFPGSENIHEFFESLQKGADFHERIPPSRFQVENFLDPDSKLKNSTPTSWGCFLKNPGLFDYRLFNVSPREALHMDPVQRLLLMTSYEALETAGYSSRRTPSSNPDRIATYMAQTTDDWRDVIKGHGIDIYHVPGNVRAFTPGKINYHFKFGGPSCSVDAACAGSSTAIHMACNALLSRECDTALAGGGQINAAPMPFAGAGRGGFLSPTGGCKTFHNDADGYCRGEGVGVVVLKRVEDAIADNDNILAVISASARTYSAGAASITQPHEASQIDICEKVLRRAHVRPEDVKYVEMHGTGTQAGDYAGLSCQTLLEDRMD